MPALTGPLSTAAWWAEVVQAGFRQALQVLLPFLVLVGANGSISSNDALAAAVAVSVAFVLVVLRRVAGATASDDATLLEDLFYRAVSAFAGSLLGVLSADGLDLLHVDFGAVLLTAASSAAVAAVHGIVDPARRIPGAS